MSERERDWLTIIISLVLTSYIAYVIGAAVINTVCGGCLVE